MHKKLVISCRIATQQCTGLYKTSKKTWSLFNYSDFIEYYTVWIPVQRN